MLLVKSPFLAVKFWFVTVRRRLFTTIGYNQNLPMQNDFNVSAVILPALLIKLFTVITRLPTNAMLVLLIKSPFLAVKF